MKNLCLSPVLYQTLIAIFGSVKAQDGGTYDSPDGGDTTSDEEFYVSSSTTSSPTFPNNEESEFAGGVLIACGIILGLFIIFILYKKYCETKDTNTKSKKSIKTLQAQTKSAANKIDIKVKQKLENAKMKE